MHSVQKFREVCLCVFVATFAKSGIRDLQNANGQKDSTFKCPGNSYTINDDVYIISNQAQKCHPSSAAAQGPPPHLCTALHSAGTSPSAHTSAAQLVIAVYCLVPQIHI